ncbi:glycosyltransferase family 2 protein [Gloeocapsopsis crepidinum LEGE 06123]|uniref:Glycosyltransferase family 2 protein n=1 Tax=Gloeocapsopsis crepidinum LEGE 06123 TaxID=588587 RepID=A0ABR9UW06_9CHRO|nr:glycosyltransferase family A protein [Gloeocapsopsis crepidinum]MBE9192477.1 glycosyltransferase family 2 protein [Gloeocapsopsis crepidinum LEGE 06123]
MKVTVIIPVYKVEKYIAETVRSVLQQTYSDFELLLVDDGSPDASVEVCQNICDPRIKILRQHNQGPAAARNLGIRHAQGEYIAFIDGDDLWLPQKLEKHLEHLHNSPDVGVSFSRSAFIDEAGHSLGIYQLPTKLQNITPAYVLCRNPIGNGSTLVVRRAVLEAIKFECDRNGTTEDCYFDPQFRGPEDVECWLRIALQTNWQIEGIPDVLTLYRVNSGGLSANLYKQLEAWERVLDKTRDYAPEFIAQWEKPAKAYMIRYLARRAVTLRAASIAVELIHRAMLVYWRILLEEPRRTLLTWGAAYALLLLPQFFYDQMEAAALKTTGMTQRRRILQDLSGELV